VELWFHALLISALDGVVSSTPQPLYPIEKVRGSHWIVGWVAPRAGLDAVVKRKIPRQRILIHRNNFNHNSLQMKYVMCRVVISNLDVIL